MSDDLNPSLIENNLQIELLETTGKLFKALEETFNLNEISENPFNIINGWTAIDKTLQIKRGVFYNKNSSRKLEPVVTPTEELVFTGLGLCQLATVLPFLSNQFKFNLSNLYRIEFNLAYSEVYKHDELTSVLRNKSLIQTSHSNLIYTEEILPTTESQRFIDWENVKEGYIIDPTFKQLKTNLKDPQLIRPISEWQDIYGLHSLHSAYLSDIGIFKERYLKTGQLGMRFGVKQLRSLGINV
jgi:hypothetical protein